MVKNMGRDHVWAVYAGSWYEDVSASIESEIGGNVAGGSYLSPEFYLRKIYRGMAVRELRAEIRGLVTGTDGQRITTMQHEGHQQTEAAN